MASAKSNRINVTNPVYCLLLTDTSAGTTYDAVETLGKAMQIQITPQIAAGEQYGNGAKEEDIALLKGLAVVIDLNKLFIETRAKIMGNTYVDGVLIEKDGDQPPYIAIGYEVEQTGGTKEQIWLLKGRARPANQTVQQSAGNINFSNDSITVNFIPRESDKQIRFFGDTANSTYTAAQATAFFATGPVSYPAATP
ncbi:phage tail protein [Lacrimispora amygdalina]|uniref:Phage tail protein n=1 Tax=Lacrimispora amygdalina TaxID=253257 RepID=A0A3E2ND26_9FIRM|nr:major tail protein [Clostridium indicum]RFZ78791.1 phage tail protein [Clostridium indicum]